VANGFCHEVVRRGGTRRGETREMRRITTLNVRQASRGRGS